MNLLSKRQLLDVRDTLAARIRAGLSMPEQEVRCLPAYLRPPAPNVAGKAVVVDAGGTNVRAAAVELLGSGPKVVAGPNGGLLPDGRDRAVDAAEFFQVQADLVHKLGAPRGLPLGYCFSYPAEITSTGDARLLFWTKGIKVTGVVGELVGSALAKAIGDVPSFKVLNDTVAALMGGAAVAAGKYDHIIGLIVGTGTNMATFLEESHIPKLRSSSEGKMAVNLESGNFHPPHLSEVDAKVDAETNNPGRQLFEKAVSGFYLPFLFAQLKPGLAGFDPRKGAGQLDEIRRTSSDESAVAAADWCVHRSADLVAASLAGTAELFPSGSLAVQAEGGLFWKMPGYAARVESTLQELLSQPRTLAITRTDDVNLIGAACAALG